MQLVNEYSLKLTQSNFYNKGALENIKPYKTILAVQKLMAYSLQNGNKICFAYSLHCCKEKTESSMQSTSKALYYKENTLVILAINHTKHI